MHIGVIGAGIGGLAIAIRLAAKGHQVTVFEKNSYPGGKIAQLYTQGYRFDTGPSLFTLPEWVDELFHLCNKHTEDYFTYSQVKNNCKYFYPDGTVFNFYHDQELLKQEILNRTTEAPEHIYTRLATAKEVYEISAPVFLLSSFHKLSNFNTPPYKQIARKLHKLDFFWTMHQANQSSFTDPHMIQLFDRYATYNGSDPYRAPATLNMIAHLENNIGAFFPAKGMYHIADSLYRLATHMGVQFNFKTGIEEILIRDKQAVGLRTSSGEDIPFDRIVSDVDTKQVATRLLKNHPLKNRLQKASLSSSALIFYWGIKKQFPDLDLHNILFSADYPEEFRKIFRDKGITGDPTIYIFISSKQVPEDAPAGCENWFVMINVPADQGQDWDELIPKARRQIIAKINRFLQTDIEKYIETEQTASPLTIEKNTYSMHGALYGTASNSIFSAFLRHPNFLRKIAHLYFVGGSVHPGGGIPLCLASAKIVEQEMKLNHG